MTPEPAVAEAHDEYLLAQVREAFGRVVYSHKTHEKQTDLCFKKHRCSSPGSPSAACSSASPCPR